MAKPIIEYGERHYDLADNTLHIGRAPDNDIVIKSPGVSDYHAELQYSEDQIILTAIKPVYWEDNKLSSTAKFSNNALINIGTTHINLWFDVKAKMPKRQPCQWWHWLTHPLAALTWFILALALPLWIGFLNTDQRYVLDIRLLFYTAGTLFILVWIIQMALFSLAKRYLFFPLLGIVSFFSLILDLSEQAAYWFNFQFNQGWFNYLSLVLSIGIFLYIFRSFLRDYVLLAGKWLFTYTLLFASPCLLVVIFVFLQNNDFYEYRRNHYPSYHNGLLPEKIDSVKAKSIDELFTINKTE